MRWAASSLDDLHELSVIRWVLLGERLEVQSQASVWWQKQGRVGMLQILKEQAKERSHPQQARQGKKRILDPSEGREPCHHFGFSTSDLQYRR